MPAKELTTGEQAQAVFDMRARAARMYRAAGTIARQLCKELGKDGVAEMPDGRRVRVNDIFRKSDLAKKEVYIERYELELVDE